MLPVLSSRRRREERKFCFLIENIFIYIPGEGLDR